VKAEKNFSGMQMKMQGALYNRIIAKIQGKDYVAASDKNKYKILKSLTNNLKKHVKDVK
jgi:hypothetical protein